MATVTAEQSSTDTHSQTDPLGEVSMKWSAVRRDAKPKSTPVCKPLINNPTYCTSIVISPKSTPASKETPAE